MLPSALPVGHSLVTRCIMRSVFSGQSGAAIFGAVSAPRRGWTKFAIAQSPLDPKRIRAQGMRLALGALCRDHHLLFNFCASSLLVLPLLLLSRLASGAV